MAQLLNSRESDRSVAQIDHAHNSSITNQASDSVTPFRPHFHRSCYRAQTFRDFYTPDSSSIIYALGPKQSLSSLERTLTSTGDIRAIRYDQTADLSSWVPLIVALNTVCAQVGLQPISETDLKQLLQSPWFQDFAKQSAKYHNFENKLDLDNLASVSTITEDHMIVVLEAFAACHSLEKIELGVLHIQKKCVKVTHYPWTATVDKHTAWIIVDHRLDSKVFHGLGRPLNEKQVAVADDQDSDDDSSDDDEQEEEDGEEEDDEEDDLVSNLPKAPISTSRNAATVNKPTRDTASRIVAQRTPLNAGLTVDDVMNNHVDRLHYNNVLKVGLCYSNAEIAKKVHEADTVTKQKTHDETPQKGASGIVKRINTAIKHIEDTLNIKSGAFRTAYDRQRKLNNIPIRGKDEVSDADLATFANQINGAIAWVQSGGPRPPTLVPYGTAATTTTTTVSGALTTGYVPAFAASSGHVLYGYAPASTMPHGYAPASAIPMNIQGSTAPYYLNTPQINMGDGDLDMIDGSSYDNARIDYNDYQMSGDEELGPPDSTPDEMLQKNSSSSES
ncbi:hypothetical protein E4T42_01899 [Aureobasidium subglaciale]|nr:hypothetical protein E4T42_01899 [Aureobasidium subglaciale]